MEGCRPEEDKLGWAEEGARLKSSWSRLELRRNIVGWKWVEPEGETRWLTNVPLAEWEKIIKDAHGGWLGGHLGVSHMKEMIRCMWYWLGLTGQVWLWVAGCMAFQGRKPAPFKKRSPVRKWIP